jgi:uncharacterized membrane protein YgcG
MNVVKNMLSSHRSWQSVSLAVTLTLVVSSLGLALQVPAASAVSGVATTPNLEAPPTPSGFALNVDNAESLPVVDGCSIVATNTRSDMASIAVSATGGAQASTLTVGSSSWTIQAGQTFTTTQWVQLQDGGFTACFDLADLQSESLQLLANTVTPTADSPGGLINISARIPLLTSGTTSGSWALPADATPSSVAGLLLQVSSSANDVVNLSSGDADLEVAVGPEIPASTVVLPDGSPSWSGNSGTPPDALLLGFITNPSDGTTGGALLNLLAKPVKVSGAQVSLAGKGGLPALGAQIPATSVLANVTGNDPGVEDSLAAGRQTPSGAMPKVAAQSFLRLADDGRIHFTGTAHLSAIAWLMGDVINAPDAVDLTLPGSAKLKSIPTTNTLIFGGQQDFAVGSTLDIGVSKYTPNGLIAIVDAVSTTSRRTMVTYHTGALLDAFSQLTLVAQIPASASDEPPEQALNGARISTLAPISQSAFLGFSSSKGFQLGSSLSGSVSFHFDPSVTLAITIGTGWLGLPSSASLHFAVDTTSSVTATVTAQAGASAQQSFDLARLSLTPFDLGPVVIVPELAASLSVNANIAAAVSISGTMSEHSHVGMTMSDGISRPFSFYGDSNNGFGAPTFSGGALEGSISAHAEATLTFQFDLLAYGEIGPDAQASATIALDVNPESTPTWKVTASGDFSIGINLNALNISVLTDLLKLLGIPTNPNWSIGHLGPWVIATGSGGQTGGNTGGQGAPGQGSGQGPTGTGGNGSSGGGGSTGGAPAGATVTVGQGPAAPFGNRYAITLAGFNPNSSVGITCFDSQDPGGFYYFTLNTDSNGNASTSSYCYSATGPNYWVVAGGVESNMAQWSETGSTPPAPGSAIQIGWSSSYPGWIYMSLDGFPPGSYQYTCQFASGGNASFTVDVTGSSETIDNGHTCFDLEGGDTVSVSIDSVESNSIIVGGAPPPKGSGETTGGVTNTWTDFSDAGGSQGPTIQRNEMVAVTCRVQGFTVADGNDWWYQIGSSPWNGSYYASADAFYNNGATSGSLLGTPFVDASIPTCSAPPPPPNQSETTGGPTNTWTNYTNAGGSQGPTIGSNVTVEITCALQGFRVADGNTWWYQIGSSPWNNVYYASADAFYNLPGVTSGSLHGTPFVDTAIPQCGSSGRPETTGGPTNTWTNYTNAGGSQGPTIGSNATVGVNCAIQGFAVADGNTWWYQIGSGPWNGVYYASADAFYNNGQTSGSLIGTPFVDPAVPHC